MTHQEKPMTDEEFAGLLLKPHADTDDVEYGDAGNEVKQVRSALHGYRSEMLQWAGRRSAGQPSLAEKAHQQERWAALPQWSLALVALVTVVGGVAHFTGTRSSTEPPPAISMEAAVPTQNRASTPDEIAADNQLLSSIDAELSYHRASPVDSLRLHSTEQGSTVTGATD